ncbi:MAG TPA: hypothetical protein VN648_06325, partial [Candidatus Methylomirabilis sp.]|nr:hypothetical protein [Candidatus Methylomirabilis sp.]
MNEVMQARADALAGTQMDLQTSLVNQKTSLVNLLRKLDSAGDISFSSVVLDTDGILIKGDVKLSARLAPYAAFQVTADGKGYTALESWIPGGRIDEYIWTYYYKDYFVFPYSIFHRAIIFENRDSDRFVFRLPAPPEPSLPFYPDGKCLLIRGSCIDPATGDWQFIESGDYCNWTADVPPIRSLREPPLPYAIWIAKNLPDPPPPEALFPEAGIIAHLNVAAGGDPAGYEQTNALVQMLGGEAEIPQLGALAQALRTVVPPGVGLTLVVVFRQGMLNRLGRSIIPEMQKLGESLGDLALLVTEDYQASWSRAFDVPDGAASFLINA